MLTGGERDVNIVQIYQISFVEEFLMKAAFLTRPETLILEDLDDPICGDEEVVVEIKASGLCGSDLHYFKDGKVGTNVVTEPHILGHESAGEIVECGKNVNTLRKGDKVTIEPGVPCLRCSHCLTGKYHLCNSIRFLGAPPNHGTFRSLLAHNALFVHKLPEGISYLEGAFVEPFAVAFNAIVKAEVKPGESILITGSGTIGLVILQLARIAGASWITVADLDEFRLGIASNLGADEVVTRIGEDLEPSKYDCVIEATGDGRIYDCVVGGVKKGGRVVIVGMSNSPATVDFTALLRKEAKLLTVYRYANYYQPILKLFEAQRLKVEEMVSHRFSLAEIDRAFLTAVDKNQNTLKIMIE